LSQVKKNLFATGAQWLFNWFATAAMAPFLSTTVNPAKTAVATVAIVLYRVAVGLCN